MLEDAAQTTLPSNTEVEYGTVGTHSHDIICEAKYLSIVYIVLHLLLLLLITFMCFMAKYRDKSLQVSFIYL